MSEVVVIDVALEESLQELSQYLWSQGVSHRILETDTRRMLLVGDQQVAAQVHELYQKFKAGETDLPPIELPHKPNPSRVLSRMLQHLPVTLACIVLSILGFFIVSFDTRFEIVKLLTFFEFDRVRTDLVFSLPEGQYWRLITPIFLHFGIMHIAFNMTLLWFVGQRIELLQGSLRMVSITLLIALGSNIMQAKYADLAIFGGMSGVVYGLLGYGWVWSLLRPEKHLHIPEALFYVSLVMMVLGFVGFAGLLGAGKVANIAHLGGLIMGCLAGLGAALIDKYPSDESSAK